MSAESRIWHIEQRFRRGGKWELASAEVYLFKKDSIKDLKIWRANNGDRYEYRAVAYVRETERKG